MSKRILIVSDSLGAPRKDAEIISYDETWVGQLSHYLQDINNEVICFTENGLSSGALLAHCKHKLTLYDPDMIIFQYGIVDCAPRVLTDREKLFFRMIGLTRPIHKIAHKYHAELSRKRNKTLYTIAQFENHVSNIYSIIKEETSAKIFNIAIAPANDVYINKSPGIKKNIAQFNAVLKKYSDIFIEYNATFYDVQKIFLPDAHHLNKDGHIFLYAVVKNYLDKVLERA